MHDLTSPEAARIRELLDIAVEQKASDLHLSAGQPAVFRINGRLIPYDMKPMSEQDLKHLKRIMSWIFPTTISRNISFAPIFI